MALENTNDFSENSMGGLSLTYVYVCSCAHVCAHRQKPIYIPHIFIPIDITTNSFLFIVLQVPMQAESLN